MPKYVVRVYETHGFRVEVDAPTRQAAESEAMRTAHRSRWEPFRSDMIADCIQQLGEPWVYGPGGDDPDNIYSRRPDGYANDPALLVFYRAHGNVFTEAEVALLCERVTKHVGTIFDKWNGVGTRTLSIRAIGPGKTLTEEQITAIMAPKET